jgi:high-affinity nickel permease
MPPEKHQSDQARPATNPHILQTSNQKDGMVKFFSTRNLSVIVMGVIFLVALWRAQPKDIPQIVETICGSHDISIIGWLFALIILVSAIVFLRILTRIHDREIERLVKERDKLQKKLLSRSGGQHDDD